MANIPPLGITLPVVVSRKNPHSEPADLSPPQQAAIELLAAGRTVTAAAQGAGVVRLTIYRWMRDDPTFRAAYAELTAGVRAAARHRMLALANDAVRAVRRAVKDGDAHTAMALIRTLNLAAPGSAASVPGPASHCEPPNPREVTTA